VARPALPLFTDGGSIFLNGSITGIKGFPSFSVYSASRAAVRSFARTWLVYLKHRNIRVNVATVALFLASEDSSFVNGTDLYVDGGTAQI
jgi:NAD(P)-dependent dehydrogenase (short-subunit alcohol dehydrogenase family)